MIWWPSLGIYNIILTSCCKGKGCWGRCGANLNFSYKFPIFPTDSSDAHSISIMSVINNISVVIHYFMMVASAGCKRIHIHIT